MLHALWFHLPDVLLAAAHWVTDRISFATLLFSTSAFLSGGNEPQWYVYIQNIVFKVLIAKYHALPCLY